MNIWLKKGRYLVLPIVIWFFYIGLAMHNYGYMRTGPEPQNYFRNLAHSILQGRLDIDCPKKSGCYDILIYKEKKYLYWPPAPALTFYLPIVAAMGEETPDKLISSLIGAFNVLFFSIVILLFTRRFSIPISFAGIALLTLFWGMGTVHFYMSMKGSIWCMAQVCAQTFLLLSFIFALMRPSAWRVFCSGIFFGLACYTRNHLIFAAIPLIAVQWPMWKNKKRLLQFKTLVIFGIPFIAMSFANLWYNHARFGEYLNNGMEYQHMSTFLRDAFNEYGFFNTRYFTNNIWVQVLSPPIFSSSFPFFKLDVHGTGFSFFWASPLFVLIIPAFFYGAKDLLVEKSKRLFSATDHLITGALLLAVLGIATPIMLNIAPGWRQFASRYSLDYQLLMILIGLFLIKVWGDKKWFIPLCVVLVFFSVYINYFGAYLFLNLGEL